MGSEIPCQFPESLTNQVVVTRSIFLTAQQTCMCDATKLWHGTKYEVGNKRFRLTEFYP